MVLPRIMTGHNVLWPTFFRSARSWIQANFIVRPSFDKNFRLSEFVDGARQAFVTVSDKIADGDTSSLKGLVSDEVLESVKKSLANVSLSDRESIRRQESDVYLTFPYELGIIMNDDDANKRWVEIMMVYHTLRGFEQLQKENISSQGLQQKGDRFLFANFRFSRNYSKDVKPEDSSWTINYLNYFTPESDHEEAKKQHLNQ